MRIALFRPEIAGNVGAVLRLAACLAVPVDVIEPCGFAWSDTKLRRAGMDYIDDVSITRHVNWAAFHAGSDARIVLLTIRGDRRLHDFDFAEDDVLLFGSESSGVPGDVAGRCTARLRIPLAPTARSLNLSVACGIAVVEALRQTGRLPA